MEHRGDGSGAAFDTAYDVTEDLTVYAQWKKQEDTPQPPADPGGSNAGTSDNGGSQPQAAPQQPAPQPAAAEAAAPAASAAPAAAIPQTGDELPAGALGVRPLRRPAHCWRCWHCASAAHSNLQRTL